MGGGGGEGGGQGKGVGMRDGGAGVGWAGDNAVTSPFVLKSRVLINTLDHPAKMRTQP